MPLFINGGILDKFYSDIKTLFDAYPSLKEYSRRLLPQPHKSVIPNGSLHVMQREFAVVAPTDQNISIVGTTEATTCSIVILRHSGTGVVALGHFDGSGKEKGIEDMIYKVQEYSSANGDLELHMIGGFLDVKGYSAGLCLDILYCFQRQPVNIHLITACVCELNNFVRGDINLPVIHGAAVNVKTGELYPAIFADKGPDIPLRASRLFSPGSPDMLMVYESYGHFAGLLQIKAFTYEPVRGIDDWMKLGDDLILKYLSTSPEAEGPSFVADVRRALAFIKKHPFPSVTVFPKGQALIYRKDEFGSWVPCQ